MNIFEDARHKCRAEEYYNREEAVREGKIEVLEHVKEQFCRYKTIEVEKSLIRFINIMIEEIRREKK